MEDDETLIDYDIAQNKVIDERNPDDELKDQYNKVVEDEEDEIE